MGKSYVGASSPESNADGRVSVTPHDPSRAFRRKRARRAALGYVVVWSLVAALALLAQVIAPAAAT